MILGVVGNPRYEGLPRLLGRLADAAPRHNVILVSEVGLRDAWPDAPPDALDLDRTRPDAILCLGGDGTFLRTARLIGEREVPIYGTNLGRVGFLTTGAPDTLEEDLAALADGRYTLETRRALTSVIHDAAGAERTRGEALNDIVVHKAGVARVIRIQVVAGGEEIGTFSADGLVVATPTGSTAYSLSAGGPIVVPGVDALVVTPICPHTLAVRPIVVPGDVAIDVTLLPPVGEETLVSFDGQMGTDLRANDCVRVERARHGVKLIRLERDGFFARMRRKLQWGDLTARDRDFHAD